jgi:hypothetical protein
MSGDLGTIGQAIYEAYASRYPDGLVDTRDAAGILRLRPTYLETLRCKGGGPGYVRMGARVYYQLRTLAAWADSRVRTAK